MTRLSIVCLLLVVGFASAESKKLVPNRNWVDVITNEALKKEAPENGFITDTKTFEKVWKAWRPKEKVPTIDFAKEFVIVTYAGGPNRPSISATIDEGKVKILAIQTLIGGDGFGYSLASFPRKDVKSVNGKDLPAAK